MTKVKDISPGETAEAIKLASERLLDAISILVPLTKMLETKQQILTGESPEQPAGGPVSLDIPESTLERMRKAGYHSAAEVLQDDAETIQKKMALTPAGMQNLVWRFHLAGLRIRGAEPEDPNV